MIEHVFRLKRGQDIKQEVMRYAQRHNIAAGTIVCGVGCVTDVRIRIADGVSVYLERNRFEIVSLQGTVSKDGSHIHIALSDDSLRTIGGHLMDGCIVNTTCEIILLELQTCEFQRQFDEETGYKELFVECK